MGIFSFALEKPVKWFKEQRHFLKAKDMRFSEVSDLGLDRTTWKELGLEGTSRLERSFKDKQVQFRKSKFKNTKSISNADL